jgi:hypothetical protein
MNTIRLIALLLLFAVTTVKGQTTANINMPVNFNNIQVMDALDSISTFYHIHFSYQSNLPGLYQTVSYKGTLNQIDKSLNIILRNTGLTYRFVAGQVVISALKESLSHNIYIKGKLCRYGTTEPVSFAGIEMKRAGKGIISDENGFFSIDINPQFENDTLCVSSINFKSILIPVKELTLPGLHTFYMVQRTYALPDIEIKASMLKREVVGNHKLFSAGAFYLDTHGQQTALHIYKGKNQNGRLLSASFYLSGKGNTDAPFRVHVYAVDTVTGKPTEELLPEMIIIKPQNGKGWYKIDLANYRINMPETGLFIGIEGIFPGDYESSFIEGNEEPGNPGTENNDDFDGETLSYGQQIGYSGGNQNNTWHYSTGHSWFQLKKKHFNAMISAEVSCEKTTLKYKLLAFLGFKKIQIKN